MPDVPSCSSLSVCHRSGGCTHRRVKGVQRVPGSLGADEGTTRQMKEGGSPQVPERRLSVGGRRSSVPAAVLHAPLVLQVVITVLTNSHRRRDLQPLDL